MFIPILHTSFGQLCAHDQENYSPDDGHVVARNMYRIEINIREKLCIRLAIYKEQFYTTGFLSSQYNSKLMI